jgi:hypothetical protein
VAENTTVQEDEYDAPRTVLLELNLMWRSRGHAAPRRAGLAPCGVYDAYCRLIGGLLQGLEEGADRVLDFLRLVDHGEVTGR